MVHNGHCSPHCLSLWKILHRFFLVVYVMYVFMYLYFDMHIHHIIIIFEIRRSIKPIKINSLFWTPNVFTHVHVYKC